MGALGQKRPTKVGGSKFLNANQEDESHIDNYIKSISPFA